MCQGLGKKHNEISQIDCTVRTGCLGRSQHDFHTAMLTFLNSEYVPLCQRHGGVCSFTKEPHVLLSGYSKEHKCMWSSAASAYPPQLCAAVARIACRTHNWFCSLPPARFTLWAWVVGLAAWMGERCALHLIP